MKRFAAIFIVLIILFPCIIVTGDGTPDITSSNLIVIRSADNGQILYNTSNGKSVAPSVSAKLMTAMLAYDMITSLDQRIEVNAEALRGLGIADIHNPMIGIRGGNSFSAQQLLEATLISAANDACSALAYFVSDGDISGFVDKMNQRADELGCQHTYFTNPTGTDDISSYTTVEDVSIIASAFYRYNTLLELSSKPTYMMGTSTMHTKNYLISNALLNGYTISGAMGMIAGQRTSLGDYTLITSAEKSGLGYIYVIMNAPGESRQDGVRNFPDNNAYTDMKKLYNWAIDSFGYMTLITKNEVVGELPVSLAAESYDHVNYGAAEDLELLIPKTFDKEDVVRRVILDAEAVEAPIQKNTRVGRIEFYINDGLLGQVELVTLNTLERSQLLSFGNSLKNFLYGSFMKKLIKIFILIIIIYIMFLISINVLKVVRLANKKAENRSKIKTSRLKPPQNDDLNKKDDE